MANDVQVELGLDSTSFKKEMDRVSDSVSKLGDSINNTFSSKIQRPIDTFKGTLGGLVAFRGLEIIADQFRRLGNEIATAINVAETKQNNLQKLQFTLTATGRGATQATEEFSKFADSIERSTRFTDDQVLASANFLASTTNLTNQGIKEAIKASADLATVMGVDLMSATETLAKAEQGHLDRTLKMKLGVEEAGNATETYARVLERLKDFSGQSGASLESFSGSTDQLAKSYENLTESLGNVFINNEAVLGFLAGLREELNQTTADTEANASTLSENLSAGIQFAIAFAKACVDTADVIGRAFRIIYDVIVGTIVAIPTILNKVLVGIGDTVTGFVGIFDEALANNMRGTYATFKADTESMGNFVIDKFKDIGTAVSGDTYLSGLSNNIDKLGEATTRGYEKRKALDDKAEEEQARKARVKSEEALAREGKLQADLTALILQAEAERDLAKAQTTVIVDENINEFDKRQAELDNNFTFEAQKNAITFQAEIDKSNFIKDEDERRLAQKKLHADYMYKQEQLTTKNSIANAQLEADKKKKIKEGELTATQNFLQAGIMLAQEGSAIQKGLMVTQAIVNTYAGATRAMVDYPFPASVAVSASVIALGLANVAKIAGAKFEDGGYLNGIVAGNSVTGDKVNVAVNSREMILTTQQQAELFRLANGGARESSNSSSFDITAIVEAIRSTPIVVQANGREIARLVREESRSGFSF